MSLETRNKQSSDVLDFPVEFERFLSEDDTITTIEATLDITGELNIDAVQNASPTVLVWLSGGINGKTYKVTVKVGTSAGRVKETEFRLRIKDY